MTKLLEWITVFSVFAALWLAIITNKLETGLMKNYPNVILLSPIIFVILFGLYALTIVLYRVFTFNNCEEAAVELKKEIDEAKTELAKKGFKTI